MKTKMINFISFCCMVIVLGTQALLHGSWKVQQTGTIKSNPKKSQ